MKNMSRITIKIKAINPTHIFFISKVFIAKVLIAQFFIVGYLNDFAF